MILRLHGAWDGTEHVLGSTGHSHHAVGLQLAEIDDGVRLPEVGGIGELTAHLALRVLPLGMAEIPVQTASRLLHLLHPGGLIHPLDIGGVVQSAGAVPHHHVRSTLCQHAHQGAQQRRVGGGRPFRLEKGHQVGLDGDSHPRLDPSKASQGLQHSCQGGLHLPLGIVLTGSEHHIRFHTIPPLDKKLPRPMQPGELVQRFEKLRLPRTPRSPPRRCPPAEHGWTGTPSCSPRRWR